ncbi:MAG: HU family DNA-binding protein [Tannerellaceae bacterium]|nr:HU family DNA-binding protein [Tannerellaceae bacterium]
MALKYHLVLRRDMRDGAPEGSKLYYGQVRKQGNVSFDKICEAITAYSTASKGDIMLVINGLLFVMKQYLEQGDVVEMGEFGNFRMSAGSSGVENQEDFHTSLFRNGRIVFTPGKMLKESTRNVRFEKLNVVEREKECDRPHTI